MRRNRGLISSLLGILLRSSRSSRSSSFGRRRSTRRRGGLYLIAVLLLSAFGAHEGGYIDLNDTAGDLNNVISNVGSYIASVKDKFATSSAAPAPKVIKTASHAPAFQASADSRGNTTNDSFAQAKRTLEQKVVNDYRFTIYCGAPFDARKNITLPPGFTTPSHEKRALKVEWEHVVPAENFGRFFKEWRDGDPQCVDNKGKHFKGRNCAEKVNMQYRFMQADMHNLFPAIGAVNALRSNYNFVQFPKSVQPMFGTCEMKIQDRKAEPPDAAKGPVARATLYMDWAYPIFNLSDQQRKLMQAWDKQFPPEAWECERERKIERLQGNPNPFVKNQCS